MQDVFQVVLYVAASSALVALAWLFVSLVAAVKSTRVLIDNTNTTVASLVVEVQAIRTSLQGTIENVEVITSRVPMTLDHVNGQLEQVDGILGSVRELTEGVAVDVARLTTDATDIVHAAKGVVISLIDLEQDVQVKVQRPIVELMSIFSALGKGIHAFRMKVADTGDPHALDSDAEDEEEYDDDGAYDEYDPEYDVDLGEDLEEEYVETEEVVQPVRERTPAYRS